VVESWSGFRPSVSSCTVGAGQSHHGRAERLRQSSSKVLQIMSVREPRTVSTAVRTTVAAISDSHPPCVARTMLAIQPVRQASHQATTRWANPAAQQASASRIRQSCGRARALIKPAPPSAGTTQQCDSNHLAARTAEVVPEQRANDHRTQLQGTSDVAEYRQYRRALRARWWSRLNRRRLPVQSSIRLHRPTPIIRAVRSTSHILTSRDSSEKHRLDSRPDRSGRLTYPRRRGRGGTVRGDPLLRRRVGLLGRAFGPGHARVRLRRNT